MSTLTTRNNRVTERFSHNISQEISNAEIKKLKSPVRNLLECMCEVGLGKLAFIPGASLDLVTCIKRNSEEQAREIGYEFPKWSIFPTILAYTAAASGEIAKSTAYVILAIQGGMKAYELLT